MSKEMSESWVTGYTCAKRINGQYPIVFDIDPSLDKEEFIKGLRFGGYYGEVRFCEQ